MKNKKTTQKKCYLHNGILYNYQAIEVIILKAGLSSNHFKKLNKGLTVFVNKKPIQKIIINYKHVK